MRYFIKLAYKGTNYHGWQIQPNAVSVQETLQQTLTKVLRKDVVILGAGRTDTGVHANEMFAHFDINTTGEPLEKTLYKINSALAQDITIDKIFPVPPDAHARFSAVSRSYQYHIFCGRNPFLQDTTWQIFHQKLLVEKMNEAAHFLLGVKDFQCFARTGSDVKNYICNVSEAYWELKNKHLIFHITANRFLRNMVRSIVGTLVEVGKNRLQPDDILTIIESKNRANAGASAPAKGLFLSRITYPENIFYDR